MPAQPTSDLDKVHAHFLNFGLRQAPEAVSPLYHILCWGAIDDPDILQLAASCPPSQPSAHILFASVHYLLLVGIQHPLRGFYPDVIASEKTPLTPSQGTYTLFQDFVRTHVDTIRKLIATRLVQTNVVRRTTCLLPIFSLIAR